MRNPFELKQRWVRWMAEAFLIGLFAAIAIMIVRGERGPEDPAVAAVRENIRASAQDEAGVKALLEEGQRQAAIESAEIRRQIVAAGSEDP